MLPAASRVRRSADFAATLKRGRRARRGSVVVYVATRTTPPAASPAADNSNFSNRDRPAASARAGFIVSKAVGAAVVRNRVKRRLRHAVAARIPQWPADLDVVIRALPESAEADFRQLGSDMDAAMAAINRRRR